MICRSKHRPSVSKHKAKICPACLSSLTEVINKKLVCHKCMNIFKFIFILTLSLFLSCSNSEQINSICYSVYEFPNCVHSITIADNDPMLCDDIQMRLFKNDSTYFLWKDYHIEDSTVFIDNRENIHYIYGELYLIYYGSTRRK